MICVRRRLPFLFLLWTAMLWAPAAAEALAAMMPSPASASSLSSSSQLGLKRVAARELSLCDCPFDCLKEEGIRFHNVKLTAYDLRRLVDRLPWRLERTLQHKCYSLLTGEDIELFPDLVAARGGSDAAKSEEHGRKGQLDGDVETQILSRNAAINNDGRNSNRTDFLEAFLLPLFSILSLLLLVLLILCQRHCILDLVAPLATPTGAAATDGAGHHRRANSAAALVIETVSSENLNPRGGGGPSLSLLGAACSSSSAFRNSHSSPQIVITLPPPDGDTDHRAKKGQEAAGGGYVDNCLYGEVDTAATSVPFGLDLDYDQPTAQEHCLHLQQQQQHRRQQLSLPLSTSAAPCHNSGQEHRDGFQILT